MASQVLLAEPNAPQGSVLQNNLVKHRSGNVQQEKDQDNARQFPMVMKQFINEVRRRMGS